MMVMVSPKMAMVLTGSVRPTKRAPDGWDSARFLELFLNDCSFPFRELVLPAAGNAGRWAVNCSGKSSWIKKNLSSSVKS
jgi:hypothetical protein